MSALGNGSFNFYVCKKESVSLFVYVCVEAFH